MTKRDGTFRTASSARGVWHFVLCCFLVLFFPSHPITLSPSLLAQGGGLDPARLLKPGTDSWPTYNGDYSGRRFSTLPQITAANVKALSLAWMAPLATNGGGIKGTPLVIDGVMYMSTT